MGVKITIDQEKCTGDEFCIDACPVPCYRIDEKTKKAIYTEAEECLGCRNCEEICPAGAITVEITREER